MMFNTVENETLVEFGNVVKIGNLDGNLNVYLYQVQAYFVEG